MDLEYLFFSRLDTLAYTAFDCFALAISLVARAAVAFLLFEFSKLTLFFPPRGDCGFTIHVCFR